MREKPYPQRMAKLRRPVPGAGGRIAAIVMGVSGSGKSTVAAPLASALGLHFIDGDTLHSPANVAKMRASIPLDDDDRWPWLDRIAACLGDARRWPKGVVIACSALKRVYRDRLRAAMPGLRFVFLEGSEALIASRLAQRHGHYMPDALLASQLRTLEPPADDETDVLHVAIDRPVDEIVRDAAHLLATGDAQLARP